MCKVAARLLVNELDSKRVKGTSWSYIGEALPSELVCIHYVNHENCPLKCSCLAWYLWQPH